MLNAGRERAGLGKVAVCDCWEEGRRVVDAVTEEAARVCEEAVGAVMVEAARVCVVRLDGRTLEDRGVGLAEAWRVCVAVRVLALGRR